MNSNLFGRDNALSQLRTIVLNKTGTQVLGFLFTVAVVRIVSPELYGQYSGLISILLLVLGMYSLGLNNAVERFIPEMLSNGKSDLADSTFIFVSKIRFWSIIFLVACMYPFREHLFLFLNLPMLSEFWWAAVLFLILYSQHKLFSLVLSASMNFTNAYRGFALYFILKLLFLCLFIFSGVDFKSLIVMEIMSYLIAVVFYIQVWRSRIFKTHVEVDVESRKRLKRYAFFYNFNDLGVSFLGKHLVNFVLVKSGMFTLVAAVTVCFTISEMISKFSPTRYFSELINSLVFASNDYEELERKKVISSILMKSNLVFFLPVIGFVLFNGDLLLSIVAGELYREYSNVMLLVLLIVFVDVFCQPFSIEAKHRELADIMLYSKFSAIINLGLAFPALEYWGIHGLLISTLFSTIIKNIFIWYFVRKSVGVSGPMFCLLMMIAFIFSFGFLTEHIIKMFDFHPLILDSIRIGHWVLVAPFIFVLPIFSNREIEFIYRYAPHRAKWFVARLNFFGRRQDG